MNRYKNDNIFFKNITIKKINIQQLKIYADLNTD